MEKLLVLTFGLIPPVLYLWITQRAEAQVRERLKALMESTVVTHRLRGAWLPLEQDYLEGTGYPIGDLSCRFNARSAYIRCAVNPSGPCQGCPHYQAEVISTAEP